MKNLLLLIAFIFLAFSNLTSQNTSMFITELHGGKSFTGYGDNSGIGTQAIFGFYLFPKLTAGVLYRFDYFNSANSQFNSRSKLNSGGIFVKADLPVWKGLSIDFGPTLMYRKWNQNWQTFNTSVYTDGIVIAENSSAAYDLNTLCFGGELGVKYEFCHGIGAGCNFSYVADKNGNNVAALRSGVFFRF